MTSARHVLKVSVLLDSDAAELLEGVWMLSGVGGVQRIDAHFLPPGEPSPPPSGYARLITYLDSDDAETMASLSQGHEDFCRSNRIEAPLEMERLMNEDWENAWKRDWKPMPVGERLAVVPSWETYAPREGEAVVRLDPGMAFGTGTHETTSMLLAEIERRAREDGLPSRFLDVGTGSGLLAIAAVKLGVAAALALDNDPEAVEIALQNARLNGLPPDRIVISIAPLSTVSESFPLVVANIISGTLKDLAADLVRVTAPQGDLWLSGLLVEETDEMNAVFTPLGMSLAETRRQGEWVSLRFRHR